MQDGTYQINSTGLCTLKLWLCPEAEAVKTLKESKLIGVDIEIGSVYVYRFCPT